MAHSTPLKSMSQNGKSSLRRTPSSAFSSISTTSLSPSSSASSSPPSSPSSAKSPRLSSPRGFHHKSRKGSSSTPIMRMTLLLIYLLAASLSERTTLENVKTSYDVDLPFSNQQSFYNQSLSTDLMLPHKSLRQRTSSYEKEFFQPNSLVKLSPAPFLPLEETQVHFLADASTPVPTSKFILDGLERSSYVEIVAITIAQIHSTERQLATLQVSERKQELPLVYIVDWGSMDRDCALLQTLFEKVNVDYSDLVILMDFTASYRHAKCSFLENYKMLKHTKRSVVEKRYFDTSSNWIIPGHLIDSDNAMEDTSTIHFSPLVLRESFVELVQNVTSMISKTEGKKKRTNDVLFNWKPGDYSHHAFLRRLVADEIKKLGGNVTYMGESDEIFAEALLRSKICILAQRDEWEGHYHLFEAMASGAMVLTDPMVAMPPSLQNGTNLVVYRNLKDLKSLVRYYLSAKGTVDRLSIARNGYETVMGRHRTWHRMEEILFGEALTSVDQPDANPPMKREPPEMKLVEHF